MGRYKDEKPREDYAQDELEPTMEDLRQNLISMVEKLPGAMYPDQFPKNLGRAADYFLTLVEKQHHFQKPKQIKDKEGVWSGRWAWDYRAQVLSLFIIYIATPEKLKVMIDGGAELGLDWRGENYDEYVGVFVEFEKMKKVGIKAYRAEAIKGMKRMKIGLH